MDCENCKKKAISDTVSRYAFEELAARQDIANRRSHRLNILLVILLLLSWIGFIVYESQFEESVITKTQEVEQQADGDGNNTFVGGDNYGDTAKGQNDNNDEDPQAKNGR